MRHTNFSSEHNDFNDEEAQRIVSIGIIAGAGTIAQAFAFPEFGIGFGVLTGMLLCVPGLYAEHRKWCSPRALKTGMAILSIALFTLFMSALSHTLFKYVPMLMES